MESHESEMERERQRLIEQLLAEEGLNAFDAPVIERRDAWASVPLTYAQEVLWLLDRATPGVTAYNSPLARRIKGPLDVRALERALGALVSRHEALRTVFEAHGEAARQVVRPAGAMTIAMHDVRGLPAPRDAAAIAALRAVANAPFDLANEPGFRVALARLADDDHILLLLTHHIVSDAWSYGLIFRDLGTLYDAALNDVPADLPPVSLHFGDYAAWQRATLRGEILEEGLAFWRERLAGLPVLDLPTDFARPASQGFVGARRSLVLSPELHASVRELAQRSGATTYMVLLLAYATVLHRYAGQDDVVVGSAVAGRTRRELEEMVGYFSQALPMRVRFEGDPTVAELLARVSDNVMGAFEHQDTPLEPIVLELQSGRAQSPASLFRVVLTMQDTMGFELRLGDATISPVDVDAAGTKFDLTLLATERTDGIDLALWYRTDLFSSDYADRLLGHLRTVLEAAVADPTRRVSELPMLTRHEREQLASWNATAVDEGAPRTLVELFEAQAERVPERLALVAPDERSVTYAELNADANRLARHLIELGVRVGTPVGLGCDRSAAALVGMLGILKAGGAFLPLPPDLPSARRLQILRESGSKVLVTLAAHASDAPEDVTVIAFDRDAQVLRALSPENPVVATMPANTAYVLFTSGSTGVPKGVVVTHANAVHYARVVSRVLADVPSTSAGDGFARLDAWHFGLASTLGADLGNTSLLGSLLSGGTLHILARDVTTDAGRFGDYVTRHPLDLLKITPNHFHALVAGKRGDELAPLMPRRWLVLGGEALRLDLARALVGAGRGRILNHYGPTETTVGVLTFEATTDTLAAAAGLGAQTVPLGRPLANTHVYVVDPRGSEQPVGVPGEIWTGGAGVAEGYLERPDLTAERFILRGDERVYRSGDRARRLSDGTMEFLGRADDQVKVRGYRVELGEVEQSLRAHPGVETGVVVLRASDAGDAQLVAYVVARQDGYAVSHEGRATPEKLADWMGAQLPEYMVPTAIVMLDALPLTANGKVDRAKLPEPDGGSAHSSAFVAPRTPTEMQLAAIWADVLKRERVGATDNFLALGGHSLLAIRLLGKISKTFGVRLPLRSLFESPTVEQIAAAVDNAVASKKAR